MSYAAGLPGLRFEPSIYRRALTLGLYNTAKDLQLLDASPSAAADAGSGAYPVITIRIAELFVSAAPGIDEALINSDLFGNVRSLEHAAQVRGM